MTSLLLVGAGHAHLHVLRHAAALAAAGYRVRLLAPGSFSYSGVASATAAGALPAGTGRIDVRALAEARGVELHEGTLGALDLGRRTARASTGAELAYDVLSLNIGSVVSSAGMAVGPGVLRAKPLAGLGELDARLRATGRAAVTVVGGGSTGVELAAHLAVRRDVTRVRLVHSGAVVGADLPVGARTRVREVLTARGVDVRTGCAVRELDERRVVCEDGTEMTHDVAVLATGLSAPPLLAELGLGDDDGVPVRATLQHVDRDDVYAVGDCAHFTPRPLPRVGVHGVRQGPVLHRSLLARLGGEDLPVYRPPRRALSVLDLGAGVGLAVRGRWWWCGAGPLHLKRHIDRRWLRAHRPEPDGRG